MKYTLFSLFALFLFSLVACDTSGLVINVSERTILTGGAFTDIEASLYGEEGDIVENASFTFGTNKGSFVMDRVERSFVTDPESDGKAYARFFSENNPGIAIISVTATYGTETYKGTVSISMVDSFPEETE